MIRTVVHISALRLWHNKPELVLTFVVPILFFSIFAWIFGSRGGSGSTPQLKIAVCDEVRSAATNDTIRKLVATNSIRLHGGGTSLAPTEAYPNFERVSAESLVKRGTVNAAIVFRPSNEANQPIGIDVLTDSFDQVAGQVVIALVQKSSIAAQIERQTAQNLPRMYNKPIQRSRP